MNEPKVVIDSKTKKPALEGYFEFTVGPTVFDEKTFTPRQRICFYTNVEMTADIVAHSSFDDALEIVSEKLKQDFKTFISQQHKKEE